MIDSIGSILKSSANKFGSKVALIFQGREFTYSQLEQMSNRIANGLLNDGVVAGDRVTLYAPNSWEWLVSYYAVTKIGAVVNPINAMLTSEEVAYAVRDCGSKVLFTTSDMAESIKVAFEKTPINTFIVFGDGVPDWTESFNAILGQQDDVLENIEIETDSLSTICYTSGTTGKPKGAMLSHKSVTLNTTMTSLMHGRNENDVVVSALPLPHVYGNVVMNSAILNGMTLVMLERFDVCNVLECVKKYKATLFEGVPTMYMYLLNSPELKDADLKSLRACTVGGQQMPQSKMEEVEKRFGCPLIELWGMTELAGLGTTFPFNGPIKHGSVGIPLPFVEARIVNVNNSQQVLERGEEGELQIRGAIVMQGYYNNLAATEESIDSDGWLHTGDIAGIDKCGHIFILDRKKDVIITAGFNVYPAELEAVIAKHPDVAMVAVGSISDAEKGELAKAYVVLKEDNSPNAESILQFCREHLASYKIPRAVQFVNDFPKTSSGKVMRRKLSQLDG